MKIWDITLDENHDIDGEDWTLRIRAECDDESPCEFLFHMPRDVAKALHQQVKLTIDPALREEEDARATYASRTTVEQVQDELEHGVYDDDLHKRVWAQRVVRGEERL